jgi:hypothetical protein
MLKTPEQKKTQQALTRASTVPIEGRSSGFSVNNFDEDVGRNDGKREG